MKIIECPRDAMQGIHKFIPTQVKATYINQLLKVGFDTIDFGSFVSPKAIPQMQDTAEVLQLLELDASSSNLLAIVANVRGAADAASFEEIDYLGYPLSLSETFQQRNTNRSIDTAMHDLAEIQNLCLKNNKTLVTYLSMGFGNPYGDPYDSSYILEFVNKLNMLSIKVVSLSDTIGVSDPQSISFLFESVIPEFPEIEFGAHLHSRAEDIKVKVHAGFEAGCRRFDGALRGFGGCPMAKDDLVGNMATEEMINYFEVHNIPTDLDMKAFHQAIDMVTTVFS